MNKKIIYSLIIILLSLGMNSNNIIAQKNKARAKEFINRTNSILKYAKEAVQKNKVYTGDLNKAIHHQKYARKLFKEGKFKTASFHSQRARSLAFQAIKANKTEVKPSMNLTADEQDLIKDIPLAAQLDAEVTVVDGTSDETAVAEKDEDVK